VNPKGVSPVPPFLKKTLKVLEGGRKGEWIEGARGNSLIKNASFIIE
jgi:hypothetical protein